MLFLIKCLVPKVLVCALDTHWASDKWRCDLGLSLF